MVVDLIVQAVQRQHNVLVIDCGKNNITDKDPRFVKLYFIWDAIGVLFSGDNTCQHLNSICESRNSISSVLMAEALAIRSAVMYAASSNVKALMILSDSLSLVKLIQEGDSVPALFGILFDIYYFNSSFDSVTFYHVPRLSNVEADAAAK